MFTSRAEYRLLLRADNADQRLTPIGEAMGMVGSRRSEAFAAKMDRLAQGRAMAEGCKATPDELRRFDLNINRDGQRRSAFELLAYPEIDWSVLCRVFPELSDIEASIAEQIAIDALYQGYVARQQADIDAFRRDEALKLPQDLDYSAIGALSNEVCQKLTAARPETLGAAARISGVTPAALTALLRYVKKAGKAAA
jgi:tRNA uridine 5-carboxymethylaminomethyl modification enzyme